MDEMMRCCLDFELMGVHEAMHVVGGPGYSHGKKGTFGALGHAYICLLSVFSPLFTEISSNASTGYKYCSNLFKMSGLRSLSLTNCIKC